jgi:hypothetical protein
MMGDAVMVEVPIELMREVRDALRMCAEDLEASLEAEYPVESRSQYPSHLRRWQNDMEVVRNAQLLRTAIDMQPWAYSPGWRNPVAAKEETQ